jgi:hypothetical protein
VQEALRKGRGKSLKCLADDPATLRRVIVLSCSEAGIVLGARLLMPLRTPVLTVGPEDTQVVPQKGLE